MKWTDPKPHFCLTDLSKQRKKAKRHKKWIKLSVFPLERVVFPPLFNFSVLVKFRKWNEKCQMENKNWLDTQNFVWNSCFGSSFPAFIDHSARVRPNWYTRITIFYVNFICFVFLLFLSPLFHQCLPWLSSETWAIMKRALERRSDCR